MVCKFVADDYGMSCDINRAISELARKRIVSKVSVMANEAVNFSADEVNGDAEFGLHFDLTTNITDNGMKQHKNITPVRLFYLNYAGLLNTEEIINNIKHQHAVLKSKKFKIAYIDTHQHIHIVPKVLESLIAYAKMAGIHSIRCITMEGRHILFYFYSLAQFGFLMQIPKMIFLYAMGYFMRKRLNSAKIRYCKNLILMPLATTGNYEGLLKKFMEKFSNGNIDVEIVSHPGFETTANQFDSYTSGRFVEYKSLIKQVA